MDTEEKKVDQSPLAEDLSNKIKYEFAEQFLVKPLEKIKVKKEFQVPVSKTDKPKKDKNGIAAVDYDEVKTEVKEVDSEFRKGIVLKIPFKYTAWSNDKDCGDTFPISVGDTIVYKDRFATYFDLLKDTQLVKHYDIVGKEVE